MRPKIAPASEKIWVKTKHKAQGGAEDRNHFDLARLINEPYPFDRECEVNI
jgi:hypothetical protein